MTGLRLLADDLTGALDSAARFVPLIGAVPVLWSVTPRSIGQLPTTAAVDSGTRDLDPSAARHVLDGVAPLLWAADTAFKKIDSLLRGHVALELAACLDGFDRCILAPAFPYQGRITRSGRQLAIGPQGWRDTGVDLAALDPRIRLCDAETDADLRRIVADARALPGRTLWCGTGGLAGALAGNLPVSRPALPAPLLALIGSDHPSSSMQLAAAATLHLRLPEADQAAVERALTHGAAAVSVELPMGTARDRAADIIAAAFRKLLHQIARPGTLLVSGGETLRGICDALGASMLMVDGEIEPGIPASRVCGGRWDGQRVLSKSGAFGDAGCLARLLAGA
jgi:uncharacterized protein YgbK (DUF1537 family)